MTSHPLTLPFGISESFRCKACKREFSSSPSLTRHIKASPSCKAGALSRSALTISSPLPPTRPPPDREVTSTSARPSGKHKSNDRQPTEWEERGRKRLRVSLATFRPMKIRPKAPIGGQGQGREETQSDLESPRDVHDMADSDILAPRPTEKVVLESPPAVDAPAQVQPALAATSHGTHGAVEPGDAPMEGVHFHGQAIGAAQVNTPAGTGERQGNPPVILQPVVDQLPEALWRSGDNHHGLLAAPTSGEMPSRSNGPPTQEVQVSALPVVPGVGTHHFESSFNSPPNAIETVAPHLELRVVEGATNSFGLTKRYYAALSLPTHDPDQLLTLIDLDDSSQCIDEEKPKDSSHHYPQRPTSPSLANEPLPCNPFPNISSFELGEWAVTTTAHNSVRALKALSEIVTKPGFAEEIAQADWGAIFKKLGSTLDEKTAEDDWMDDSGWKKTPVSIPVPILGRVEKRVVGTLHHRSILAIMEETIANSPDASLFHYKPYEVFWQPDPSLPRTRVYSELYTSDAFVAADKQLQESPAVPGCSLPRVIAALMFASDETYTTSWSDEKLWPLYMFFGNESKYRRCKPSLSLCHHVAYFEKLSDNFKDYVAKRVKAEKTEKKTLTEKDTFMAHCKNELFHAQWEVLLDDELVQAMKNGVVIQCQDGQKRRFYPRIFTYSADYPEKMMIATVRGYPSLCPCPRCLVKKDDLDQLGTSADTQTRTEQRRKDDSERRSLIQGARSEILEKGKGLRHKPVEDLLLSTSWQPVMGAFSSRLKETDFDIFDGLVVDLLHEFELGVWKSLFIHLVRIVRAAEVTHETYIEELDRRFRQIPRFGRTIRRFTSDVSEFKRKAARDYEDLLQCATPVFHALLPDKTHSDAIVAIVALCARWHALAKLRMHTDESLLLLESTTVELGEVFRSFERDICSRIQTWELDVERIERERAAERKEKKEKKEKKDQAKEHKAEKGKGKAKGKGTGRGVKGKNESENPEPTPFRVITMDGAQVGGSSASTVPGSPSSSTSTKDTQRKSQSQADEMSAKSSPTSPKDDSLPENATSTQQPKGLSSSESAEDSSTPKLTKRQTRSQTKAQTRRDLEARSSTTSSEVAPSRASLQAPRSQVAGLQTTTGQTSKKRARGSKQSSQNVPSRLESSSEPSNVETVPAAESATQGSTETTQHSASLSSSQVPSESQANASGTDVEGSANKPPPPKKVRASVKGVGKLVQLNIKTVKFHFLGDYSPTIRRFGTVEGYSTELGELMHRFSKRWYRRSSKRNARKDATKQERSTARIRSIRRRMKRRASPVPKSDHEASQREVACSPHIHYFIGANKNAPFDLRAFTRYAFDEDAGECPPSESDPLHRTFVPMLRQSLIPRLLSFVKEERDRMLVDYETPKPAPTDLDPKLIHFKDDRIYSHKLLRVKYTSYDVRRGEDLIHVGTEASDIMIPNPQFIDDPNAHPYLYARVLGIFHAETSYLEDIPQHSRGYSFKRLDVLFVRWYCLNREEDRLGGAHTPCYYPLSFPPVSSPNAFSFIDPSVVLRGCHIVPRFDLGRVHEQNGVSNLAQDGSDYKQYYLNPFADRDMFMRYNIGISVGHARVWPSSVLLRERARFHHVEKSPSPPPPLSGPGNAGEMGTARDPVALSSDSTVRRPVEAGTAAGRHGAGGNGEELDARHQVVEVVGGSGRAAFNKDVEHAFVGLPKPAEVDSGLEQGGCDENVITVDLGGHQEKEEDEDEDEDGFITEGDCNEGMDIDPDDEDVIMYEL